MKAPDKICIRKDDTAPLGLTPHWIYTIKVREHDIEYIRKNALLEKISELRTIPHDNGIARDNAFVEIINIINSIK